MISLKMVERANGREIKSAMNQIGINPVELSRRFNVSDTFMRRVINGSVPVPEHIKNGLESLCLNPQAFLSNFPPIKQAS